MKHVKHHTIHNEDGSTTKRQYNEETGELEREEHFDKDGKQFYPLDELDEFFIEDLEEV